MHRSHTSSEPNALGFRRRREPTCPFPRTPCPFRFAGGLRTFRSSPQARSIRTNLWASSIHRHAAPTRATQPARLSTSSFPYNERVDIFRPCRQPFRRAVPVDIQRPDFLHTFVPKKRACAQLGVPLHGAPFLPAPTRAWPTPGRRRHAPTHHLLTVRTTTTGSTHKVDRPAWARCATELASPTANTRAPHRCAAQAPYLA